MGDRLYIGACAPAEAARINELAVIQRTLPFEPYTEDGVYHGDGPARTNPRYRELANWAYQLPDVYVASWPGRHLESLFWKMRGSDAFRKHWVGWYGEDVFVRGTTLAWPVAEAGELILKHIRRAQHVSNVQPNTFSEVAMFLNSHFHDHVFAYIV